MTQAEPNSGVRDVWSPKAAVRQRQHLADNSLTDASRLLHGPNGIGINWSYSGSNSRRAVLKFA